VKRISLGNLPPASMGDAARWTWVREAFNRIVQASLRDDDFNSLAQKMATLYGSATYDPPNLTPGGVGTIQTMPVTGAALGMQVDMSFSLDTQGVLINGWVSAADTVSYVFGNPLTGGGINLASGTVRARVWTYIP
jgi:hypothetical protein